jgi:hypothetical protein
MLDYLCTMWCYSPEQRTLQSKQRESQIQQFTAMGPQGGSACRANHFSMKNRFQIYYKVQSGNERLSHDNVIEFWLSRQCVIFIITQPYRPPRPVTAIALLYFKLFCIWMTKWKAYTEAIACWLTALVSACNFKFLCSTTIQNMKDLQSYGRRVRKHCCCCYIKNNCYCFHAYISWH